MKAYDADKRFVINYADALTVEGVLEILEMDDVHEMPPSCPAEASEEDKANWLRNKISDFIDSCVLPCWNGNDKDEFVTLDQQVAMDFTQLKRADGTVMKICIGQGRAETIGRKAADKVQEYSQNALEVCLLFKYFLHLMERPHRDRLLAVLKMMMVILKGQSTNAKYPREILRMLIQQYSVMGIREACTVLQACFVNLRGKEGMHVPADLVQEWNVRESKAHVKHMFSNKTDSNIVKRTAAIPCIHKIAEIFDTETGTVTRAKRHKKKSSQEDELKMIADFRTLRPFKYTPGRHFNGFKMISKSISNNLDGYQFKSWFEKNKGSFFM